jgi:hypothetical protein
VWAETWRETYFVEKLIHAGIATHNDSDGPGNFAIEQDKSIFLAQAAMLLTCTWKIPSSDLIWHTIYLD